MMKPKLFGLALAVACSSLMQLPVQAQETKKDSMPLSNSPSASDISNTVNPLSYRQQQARYVAEQALMRMEWNKWHGYEPSRPNTNASYITSGLYSFYPSYSYRSVYNVQRRTFRW